MRLASSLALAAVACAGNSASVDWVNSSRAERLRALDRIADGCRVPRSIFGLGDGGEIRVQPHPEETSYEQVDCALSGLRDARFPIAALGFVGNAAPAAENSNGH